MPTIDLRSDTVTRPSAAMRRAMAEAEVGDDVFLEDPTLNRLQERAAALFEREAALFVPSGSMGNLTCVMAQTRPGQEVICETNGHIYNYEMGALSALAGVLPRVVNGEDGVLAWDSIAPCHPSQGVLSSADFSHLPREHCEHGGRYGVPDQHCRGHLRSRPRAGHPRSSRRREGIQRGDVS